jgi:hypothetical protein
MIEITTEFGMKDKIETAILYKWNGHAHVPMARFKKQCEETFVVDQIYLLDEAKGRSSKSHDHFFCCVLEAYKNLPDDIADEYISVEQFRKKCLIRAGYADERSIVCSSKAEAVRIAAFVRPMDCYAIVVPSECVVTVYTAKSQSLKAMGGQDFQESKEKTLQIMAEMIGITVEELSRNSGRAA